MCDAQVGDSRRLGEAVAVAAAADIACVPVSRSSNRS